MPYASIDPEIMAWAARESLTFHLEWAGRDARFCYVSGGPQEAFQIDIQPPTGGRIKVDARTIESIDDAEPQAHWEVAETEIVAALDVALAQIRAWDDRPKGPATWTPWWD